MSGLDVEALLDSTAAGDVKASARDGDDRHRSERGDRRDKDKHRDGSRDRDRDRKRRDRSREHRRDRDDDLKSPRSEHGSANGSHRSSKRRSRSRDDDRRRSKRDDDGHRRHSQSPEYDRYYRPGGRSKRDEDDRRDRDRDRRRSASPRKRVKSKTPEPQLTEDERDRRTVFVQQLAARLRTKELIQFFEKVGPVKEAQIVKDRVSGRSKG